MIDLTKYVVICMDLLEFLKVEGIAFFKEMGKMRNISNNIDDGLAARGGKFFALCVKGFTFT